MYDLCAVRSSFSENPVRKEASKCVLASTAGGNWEVKNRVQASLSSRPQGDGPSGTRNEQTGQEIEGGKNFESN